MIAEIKRTIHQGLWDHKLRKYIFRNPITCSINIANDIGGLNCFLGIDDPRGCDKIFVYSIFRSKEEL